jgi:hypothetical protein
MLLATLTELEAILLQYCYTDLEAHILKTFLARRGAPDHVWVQLIANSLVPLEDNEPGRLAAAAFVAAELALLLQDDIIDGDSGAETATYAAVVPMMMALAYRPIASRSNIVRLISDLFSAASAVQLRQIREETHTEADYWALARARCEPFFAYPCRLGAVAVGRSDLQYEMAALGAAFSAVVLVHDDLADVQSATDWNNSRNLVIRHAQQTIEVHNIDDLQRSGALEYASNLWVNCAIRFDTLWQHSAVADSERIDSYWRDYLQDTMPGLHYLGVHVDPDKLRKLEKRAA